MNASSQNPSGAQPPNPPHDPRPLQAAVASYAGVFPVPVGSPALGDPDVPAHLVVKRPEPLMPQCFTCGTRKGPLTPCPQGRRYPSGGQVLQCPAHRPTTTPVQITAGVLRAAMKRGQTSPDELAQAEQDAGVIFDPKRAQEIWDAGYEQAKAEDRAELAQAAQDRQAKDWFHVRQRAVGQLCEGRPLDYCVEVGEVLAALDGRTPTAAPLTITWDGIVMGPSGDTPNENTLVPCTTARGGPAALVLTDEQRLDLGGLLLATLHTAEGCTTPGCGISADADDLDASNPFLLGWILLDVAGTDTGPRWWCNPLCANAAMAAARAELAAADQAAAVDPHQQAPNLLTPETATGWEAGWEAADAPADLDARYGPGASDEYGDDEDGGL